MFESCTACADHRTEKKVYVNTFLYCQILLGCWHYFIVETFQRWQNLEKMMIHVMNVLQIKRSINNYFFDVSMHAWLAQSESSRKRMSLSNFKVGFFWLSPFFGLESLLLLLLSVLPFLVLVSLLLLCVAFPPCVAGLARNAYDLKEKETNHSTLE